MEAAVTTTSSFGGSSRLAALAQSWIIPEKKKLEEDNSIVCSLNVSQRFKLNLPLCCNKSVETKKNLFPDVQVQSSLKQEITSIARTIPPSKTQPHTVFQMGLAAANHLLVGLSGFGSQSKRNFRRWTSCYGSGGHEPVIHLQNDMTMMIMNNGGVYEPYNGEPSMLLSGDQRRGSLWQKNILMGGKCQLPDFSGVILYDSDGLVVPPAKNSLPLLTWK